MRQLWNSFGWWAGQNAGAIQAISSVVTVVLTAVLAIVTYCYVRLTRELAANSHKQLLLLANPNLAVEIKVASEREVCIRIENRGTYPFRLRNGEIQARDEDGKDFTIRLRELDGVIVGAGDDAQDRAFLQNVKIDKQSVECGSFEDFLYVEFDCEDVTGLVKKRYGYSRIPGLREL